MGKTENEPRKFKCWKCGQTINVLVKKSHHSNTIMLECGNIVYQRDKDDPPNSEGKKVSCSAINMVDNCDFEVQGAADIIAKALPDSDKLPVGRPPTSDETDWIKLNTEDRRASLKSQADAAKTLFAFPSALTTIYLAIIAGIGTAGKVQSLGLGSIIPVFVWIAGGVFAMLTFTPWLCSVQSNSPTDIKHKQDDAIRFKACLLAISVAFFLVGLGLAAWRLEALVGSM
jgi:hypothetical protein